MVIEKKPIDLQITKNLQYANEIVDQKSFVSPKSFIDFRRRNLVY